MLLHQRNERQYVERLYEAGLQVGGVTGCVQCLDAPATGQRRSEEERRGHSENIGPK